MEIEQNKIQNIASCSNAIWKTFKELCSTAESIPEREKVIDMAFVIFRDKVMEYRNTDLYSYAVEYSHALIAEIERLLYPGKIKKSNYQDTKRMGYGDFVEYSEKLKNTQKYKNAKAFWQAHLQEEPENPKLLIEEQKSASEQVTRYFSRQTRILPFVS